MKNKNSKILLAAWAMIGLMGSANADTLLQPGYAVHTFGVSPDNNDGKFVVRVYDTSNPEYPTYGRKNAQFGGMSTYQNKNWTIDKLGNVYGIAIDRHKNIYVSASANWASGYVGVGDNNSTGGSVEVKYGSLGNGGTVYRLDAVSGDPSKFAELPQTKYDITNQVCEGNEHDVTLHRGPGLGNIAYDPFHDQIFVSNFSDGKIYRVGMDGATIDSINSSFNGTTDGRTVEAPYGLAISPEGDKLYFGTMETNKKPQLFSIDINKSDGAFIGSPKNENVKLVDDIAYTQNIGGAKVNDDTWAAYSDLAFTKDGELMIGVRVGCKGNFATSYNHGGVAYLLKKEDGKWIASAKTPGQGDTSYDDPEGMDAPESRTGWYEKDGEDHYNYDAGAIPLHPHNGGQQEEESLKFGPDDGYGGVAIWQQSYDKSHMYATTADINDKEGLHGFMQFDSNFTITRKATIKSAIAYKSVASSTDDDTNQNHPYDYKGIGGDVEVLSVRPVCIGSYVWEDKNKNGIQDDNEPINGASVSLYTKGADGFEQAKDIDGKPVSSSTTGDGGKYKFCNLPEGDYKVCVAPPSPKDTKYTKTDIQNTQDNNDSEDDSNIISKPTINGCEYESGKFTLVANSEPNEKGGKPGDDADNAEETWGNMTVDFGFVKNIFDLALIKTIKDKQEKYKLGDTVVFEIKVKNQENVDATKVVVKDYIPDGLILVEKNGWKLSDDKKTATKDLGALEAGKEVTVEIEFTIDPEYQGNKIVNIAEITKGENALGLKDKDSEPGDKQCIKKDLPGTDNDNDTANANGCDDIDPAQIKVEQKFDLALIKKVDPVTNPKKGDIIDFRITVINQGTVDAHDVVVKDYIDTSWFELADDQETSKGTFRWSKDGTLLDKIDVPKDQNKSVYIRLKVIKDFSGNKTVYNWAEISDDGKNTDRDSTPGEGTCKGNADNFINNDAGDSDKHIDSTEGCDDIDVTPAIIGDGKPVVKGETFCYCENTSSDKVDSINSLAILLMLFGTLLMAIRFLPREDAA